MDRIIYNKQVAPTELKRTQKRLGATNSKPLRGFK